jgi:hypothetical protein
MTREQLEAIVREWQRRLNIPHWRVVIDWDTELDPEEVYARIAREGDFYEGAKLAFASNFETWSITTANEIVAHELMHAVMFDLQAAGESAEDVMTASAYKVFSNRYLHELEGVVDRLALMLVKFAGSFDPDPAKEETTYVFNAAA